MPQTSSTCQTASTCQTGSTCQPALFRRSCGLTALFARSESCMLGLALGRASYSLTSQPGRILEVQQCDSEFARPDQQFCSNRLAAAPKGLWLWQSTFFSIGTSWCTADSSTSQLHPSFGDLCLCQLVLASQLVTKNHMTVLRQPQMLSQSQCAVALHGRMSFWCPLWTCVHDFGVLDCGTCVQSFSALATLL